MLVIYVFLPSFRCQSARLPVSAPTLELSVTCTDCEVEGQTLGKSGESLTHVLSSRLYLPYAWIER